MRVYLKAIVVSAIMISIFTFFWISIKDKFNAGESKVAQQIDDIEKKGVPNFSAIDIFGKNVELESFKNKIVILNFWASWCGPCLEEMPSLIKLIKEFSGEAVLLAVSGDSNEEDIHAFVKAYPGLKNENIYIVWDKENKISELYKVEKLPESYLFGKNLKFERKIIGTIDWHTKDSIEYINFLLKSKSP